MKTEHVLLGVAVGVWAVLADGAAAGEQTNFCGQKIEATATKVTCGDPNLEDLTPLRGLGDLEELDIQGTKVSDLGPLFGIKSKFKKLILDRTNVADLEPLLMAPKLEFLSLVDSKVVNMTQITYLTNLKELWLSRKMVDDGQIDKKELEELKKYLPKTKITLK